MLEKGILERLPIAASDNLDWFSRSEIWRSHRPVIRGRPKKFKYREPLILCGHGAYVRVDHGSLLIRNGFTHYPQTRDEFRLFPGDANLPDRIVMLDISGAISFDALNWLSDQKITLVQLNWRGEVSFVGNSSGFCAKREIADAQLAVRENGRSLVFSRTLVEQKIFNSIATLGNVFPKTENRELAISRLNNWVSKIRKSNKSLSTSTLLGFEGGAAAAYFRGWHGVPLNWTGLKKKPIPDNWLEIGPRNMVWRKSGENARHPINAMLNYGYAMLISQLRAQVIATGLDPSIGITHGNSKNRLPLIYDLMEPLRPVVDCAVLSFALSHTFSPGDFTINRVGACRINPQLARVVARQTSELSISGVVNDFLKLLS